MNSVIASNYETVEDTYVGNVADIWIHLVKLTSLIVKQVENTSSQGMNLISYTGQRLCRVLFCFSKNSSSFFQCFFLVICFIRVIHRNVLPFTIIGYFSKIFMTILKRFLSARYIFFYNCCDTSTHSLHVRFSLLKIFNYRGEGRVE